MFTRDSKNKRWSINWNAFRAPLAAVMAIIMVTTLFSDFTALAEEAPPLLPPPVEGGLLPPPAEGGLLPPPPAEGGLLPPPPADSGTGDGGLLPVGPSAGGLNPQNGDLLPGMAGSALVAGTLDASSAVTITGGELFVGASAQLRVALQNTEAARPVTLSLVRVSGGATVGSFTSAQLLQGASEHVIPLTGLIDADRTDTRHSMFTLSVIDETDPVNVPTVIVPLPDTVLVNGSATPRTFVMVALKTYTKATDADGNVSWPDVANQTNLSAASVPSGLEFPIAIAGSGSANDAGALMVISLPAGVNLSPALMGQSGPVLEIVTGQREIAVAGSSEKLTVSNCILAWFPANTSGASTSSFTVEFDKYTTSNGQTALLDAKTYILEPGVGATAITSTTPYASSAVTLTALAAREWSVKKALLSADDSGTGRNGNDFVPLNYEVADPLKGKALYTDKVTVSYSIKTNNTNATQYGSIGVSSITIKDEVDLTRLPVRTGNALAELNPLVSVFPKTAAGKGGALPVYTNEAKAPNDLLSGPLPLNNGKASFWFDAPMETAIPNPSVTEYIVELTFDKEAYTKFVDTPAGEFAKAALLNNKAGMTVVNVPGQSSHGTIEPSAATEVKIGYEQKTLTAALTVSKRFTYGAAYTNVLYQEGSTAATKFQTKFPPDNATTGVTFTLTCTTPGASVSPILVKVGTNGTAKFAGIAAGTAASPLEYTLSESSGMHDFTKAPDKTLKVWITAAGTPMIQFGTDTAVPATTERPATTSMLNTQTVPGRLVLSKLGLPYGKTAHSAAIPLNGAKFALYEGLKATGTKIKDYAGAEDPATALVSSPASIIYEGLELDTAYTLVEDASSVPGYDAVGPVRFKLVSNGGSQSIVFVDEHGTAISKPEYVKDGYGYANSEYNMTLVDGNKQGKVQIGKRFKKIGENDYLDTSAVWVTFQVMKRNAADTAYEAYKEGSTEVYAYVKANGQVAFAQKSKSDAADNDLVLPFGKYQLKETANGLVSPDAAKYPLGATVEFEIKSDDKTPKVTGTNVDAGILTNKSSYGQLRVLKASKSASGLVALGGFGFTTTPATETMTGGNAYTIEVPAGSYTIDETANDGYQIVAIYGGTVSGTTSTAVTVAADTLASGTLADYNTSTKLVQTAIFVNARLADIELTKKLAQDNTKFVPDAVYTLYKHDGTKYVKVSPEKTATTNASGVASFTGLLNGQYLMLETTVPAGYVNPSYYTSPAPADISADLLLKIPAGLKVTITEGDVYGSLTAKTVKTATDTNSKKRGLTVKKVDPAVPATALDGAVYELYGVDQNGAKTGSALATMTTGTDTAFVVTGDTDPFVLETGKKYAILEKTPPVGYEPTPDGAYCVIEVGSNGLATLRQADPFVGFGPDGLTPELTEDKLTNTNAQLTFFNRKYPSEKFVKMRETGHVSGNGRIRVPFVGAEFKLVRVDGQTPVDVKFTGAAGVYQYNTQGTVTTLISGPEGILDIMSLPAGTYKLYETSNAAFPELKDADPAKALVTITVALDTAKTGYTLTVSDKDASVETATVDGRHVVNNYYELGKIKIVKQALKKDEQGNVTLVQNRDALNGKYEIYKVLKDNQGNEIPLATILADDALKAKALVTPQALYTGTEVSGEGVKNSALSDWLEVGDYWVVEKAAPIGYIGLDQEAAYFENGAGYQSSEGYTDPRDMLLENARRVTVAKDGTTQADFYNLIPKTGGPGEVKHVRVELIKELVRVSVDGSGNPVVSDKTYLDGVKFNLYAAQLNSEGAVVKTTGDILQTIITGTTSAGGLKQVGHAISRLFEVGDGKDVQISSDGKVYIIVEEVASTLPSGYGPIGAITLEINPDDIQQTDPNDPLKVLFVNAVKLVQNKAGAGSLDIGKVDLDAKTGTTYLNGAKYELYYAKQASNDEFEADLGRLAGTKVTVSNKVVSFTDLEPGVYFVREVAAPSGYTTAGQYQVGDGTWTNFNAGAFIQVVVSDKTTTQLKVANRNLTTVEVGKYVVGSSTSRAVMTFELKKTGEAAGTEKTESATTSGNAKFASLTSGTYTLSEKSSTDATIAVSEKTIVFTIDDNGALAVTSGTMGLSANNAEGYTKTGPATNNVFTFKVWNPRKGTIEVDKVFIGSDGTEQTVTTGTITFGYVNKADATDTGTFTVTYVSGTWKVNPAKSLKAGTYTVTEQALSQNLLDLGYTVDATPRDVTIVNGQVTYLTNGADNKFTNKNAKGSLVIWKYLYSKTALQGAKYALYEDKTAGDAFDSAVDTLVTVGTKTEWTTGADGYVAIAGVPAGNYWVKETGVPAGVILASEPKAVTVVASKNGTTDRSEYTYDNIKDGTTPSGVVNTVGFINNGLAAIKVLKVADTGKQTMPPVKDVEVQLWKLNGSAYELVDGSSVMTGADGTATFSNVEVGTYRVVETDIMPAYIEQNPDWAAQNVNTADYASGAEIKVTRDATTGELTVSYPDDYYDATAQAHKIDNPFKGAYVQVIKIGEDWNTPANQTKVDEVTYSLYKEPACVTLVATGKTLADGTVTFGPLALNKNGNNYVDTTFYVREEAIDGYANDPILNPVVRAVTVKSTNDIDAPAKVQFVNKLLGTTPALGIAKTQRVASGVFQAEQLDTDHVLIDSPFAIEYKLEVTAPNNTDALLTNFKVQDGLFVSEDSIKARPDAAQQPLSVGRKITAATIGKATSQKLVWEDDQSDAPKSKLEALSVYAKVGNKFFLLDTDAVLAAGDLLGTNNQPISSLEVAYYTLRETGDPSSQDPANYRPVVGLNFTPGPIQFTVEFDKFPISDLDTEITRIENFGSVSCDNAATQKSETVVATLGTKALPIARIIKNLVEPDKTNAYVSTDEVSYSVMIVNDGTEPLGHPSKPALVDPIVIDTHSAFLNYVAGSAEVKVLKGTYNTTTAVYDSFVPATDLVISAPVPANGVKIGGMNTLIWKFTDDLPLGYAYEITYKLKISRIITEGKLENHAYLTSAAPLGRSDSNPTGAQFDEGSTAGMTVITASIGKKYDDLNSLLTDLGPRGKYLESDQAVDAINDSQVSIEKAIFDGTDWDTTENSVKITKGSDGFFYATYQLRVFNGSQSATQVRIVDYLPYEADVRDNLSTEWKQTDIRLRPVASNPSDIAAPSEITGAAKRYYYYGPYSDMARSSAAAVATEMTTLSGWTPERDDTAVPTMIAYDFPGVQLAVGKSIYIDVKMQLVKPNGEPITNAEVMKNNLLDAVNNFDLGYSLYGAATTSTSNNVVAHVEAEYASIGNYVWLDTDFDNKQSVANEVGGTIADVPGIKGVKVTLYNKATDLPVLIKDTLMPTAIATQGGFTGESPYVLYTNDSGFYLFDYLKPGQYYVEFDKTGATVELGGKTLANGDLYWAKSNVGTEDLDSDAEWTSDEADLKATAAARLAPVAATKQSAVELEYGKQNLSLDAGLQYYDNYVGDYFWFEEDGDGKQDVGTIKIGVNEAMVYLVPAATDTASLKTPADLEAAAVMFMETKNGSQDNTNPQDGYYGFSNIIPGDYRICFTLPGDDRVFNGHATPYKFSAQYAYGDSEGNENSAGENRDSNAGETGWTGVFTVDLQDNKFNPTEDAAITRSIDNYLGNFVWFDMNYNGKLDEDEWGVPGIGVKLVPLDADGNTYVDPYGLHIERTTTTSSVDTAEDDKGTYRFKNVFPGNYRLEFSGVEDWNGLHFSEEDAVSGIDAAAPYFIYGWGDNLTPQGRVLDQNETDQADMDKTGVTNAFEMFADTKSENADACIVRYGAIGDTVWFDNNNNGKQDDFIGGVEANGLDGVEGVTVRLYEADGTTLLETTTTDSKGNYLFKGNDTYQIRGGKVGDKEYVYVVEFDISGLDALKDTVDWAKPDFITDDALDSDAKGEGKYVRRTVIGDNKMTEQVPVDLNLDAGLVRIDNKLGDYFWFDVDGDGVQDEDPIEFGINGVTVSLVDAITGDVVKDINDKLLTKETAPKYDQDGKLLGNGWYEFKDMIPGDYRVKFTRPGNGSVLDIENTELQTIPSHYKYTKPRANVNDPAYDPAKDSDAAYNKAFADLDQATDLYAYSDPITVTARYGKGEKDDEWDTWDAGITRNLTNYVGNRIWLDINGNGKLDNDERGINDLNVELLHADGTPVLDADGKPISMLTTSTITSKVDSSLVLGDENSAGFYLFEKLLPGEYLVKFSLPVDGKKPNDDDRIVDILKDFPDMEQRFSFKWTTKGTNRPLDFDEDVDSDADEITGMSESFPMESDTKSLNADAGVKLLGALGNYVWLDADKNGRQDTGEAPAVGVSVTLEQQQTDGSWKNMGTKQTDAMGFYVFNELPKGVYRVTFDHDSVYNRSNYMFTAQYAANVQQNLDSNAYPYTGGTTPYGQTGNINLEWGVYDMTIDAGIIYSDNPPPPPPPPPPPVYYDNPPPYGSVEDPPYGGLIEELDDPPYGMIKTGQGISELMLAFGIGMMFILMGILLMKGKKTAKATHRK